MKSTLERAVLRAGRLYRSPRFQDAYVAGARAAAAGRPEAACPYPEDPRQTWRRAYRRAWLRGHQSIATEGGNQHGG